ESARWRRPGKNCPVYGYCAVNEGTFDAGDLPDDLAFRQTLLLNQGRDLVVLRIDDDHLVVLDQERMRLELRDFRRDLDRHRLKRDARGHRLANLRRHLGGLVRWFGDLHILDDD